MRTSGQLTGHGTFSVKYALMKIKFFFPENN